MSFTTAWLGVVGAWRLPALTRTLSASGLVPTGAARTVAVLWCVTALAAAVALVNVRTAHAGAVLALLVACAASAVTIGAWVEGEPVVCACVSATVRHSGRDHVEALVGDAALVGLALLTLMRPRPQPTSG